MFDAAALPHFYLISTLHKIFDIFENLFNADFMCFVLIKNYQSKIKNRQLLTEPLQVFINYAITNWLHIFSVFFRCHSHLKPEGFREMEWIIIS